MKALVAVGVVVATFASCATLPRTASASRATTLTE